MKRNYQISPLSCCCFYSHKLYLQYCYLDSLLAVVMSLLVLLTLFVISVFISFCINSSCVKSSLKPFLGTWQMRASRFSAELLSSTFANFSWIQFCSGSFLTAWDAWADEYLSVTSSALSHSPSSSSVEQSFELIMLNYFNILVQCCVLCVNYYDFTLSHKSNPAYLFDQTNASPQFHVLNKRFLS